KNVIRLQERHKFRLIFFSSAEVYGDYAGVMSEDLMKTIPIRQLNDYAITKWAGELMCLNSAEQFGTETVRVRPVNCYGPGEHYTPYRGFIPKFIYHALHGKPYTVHRGHKRIIDYVEDSCRTFAHKKILVTGGAGAIGSNLVRRLAETGAKQITILDNLSSSYEWNVPQDPKVRLIKGDILDKEKLGHAFKAQPDVVYHLAAHFAN